MILEAAILEVISGHEAEFESAFAKVSPLHCQHKRIYLASVAALHGKF